jgi:hypothetical protein
MSRLRQKVNTLRVSIENDSKMNLDFVIYSNISDVVRNLINQLKEVRRESIIFNIVESFIELNSLWLIIIEKELRAFVARDVKTFLTTFENLKNENRVLNDVLNETNDKINDIKQIFRNLNEQETIVIQERDEMLQERNEILKQRDTLKKELKKTRTVNEYFIDRDNTSTSESNLRQSLVESQRSAYSVDHSITSSSVVFIKSVKISNFLVYENNKNNDFDAWLFNMRNKLKVNSDWYSTKAVKKAYVQSRIEKNVIKHVTSRFRKNSIKSFLTAKAIFDDLKWVYDDSNRKQIFLKKYQDIKQMRKYREFHVFWSKFQRLFNELSLIEKMLLNDLRVKMSYKLQKMLTIKCY